MKFSRSLCTCITTMTLKVFPFTLFPIPYSIRKKKIIGIFPYSLFKLNKKKVKYIHFLFPYSTEKGRKKTQMLVWSLFPFQFE